MTSSTADVTLRRIRLARPYFIVILLLVTRGSTLTRGPYLQSVTTTGAIVVWLTDQPGNSRVDYGVGASLYPAIPQSFSAHVESTFHTVFAIVDGCALKLQAVQPDGTVFDSTTLTKTCHASMPVPTPNVELSGQIFLPVVWKE